MFSLYMLNVFLLFPLRSTVFHLLSILTCFINCSFSFQHLVIRMGFTTCQNWPSRKKGPVAQNRDNRTEQSGIGVWGSSWSKIWVDGTKSAQNEERTGEQVISIM